MFKSTSYKRENEIKEKLVHVSFIMTCLFSAIIYIYIYIYIY